MSIKIVYVPQFEVTFNYRLLVTLRECASRHYDGAVKALVGEVGAGASVNGLLTIIWHRFIWSEQDYLPMSQRTVAYLMTYRDLDLILKCMEIIPFLKMNKINLDMLCEFEGEIRAALTASTEKTNEHS